MHNLSILVLGYDRFSDGGLIDWGKLERYSCTSMFSFDALWMFEDADRREVMD